MKKLVLIILFLASTASASHAQMQQHKELDAELVATYKFEESRLQILTLVDSLNAITVQMFEFKDGSKPRTFLLEFYTDDTGFRRFDESLERFGHIERKSSGMKVNLFSGDSSAVKLQMQQNDSVIQLLSVKLLSDDINYDKVLLYRSDLQKENEKLQEMLVRMRISGKLPNRIKILLSS